VVSGFIRHNQLIVSMTRVLKLSRGNASRTAAYSVSVTPSAGPEKPKSMDLATASTSGSLKKAILCMQGNGIPDELDPVLFPTPAVAVGSDEVASCDGTINLEAVIKRENGRVGCSVEAQVVQDQGHGVNFGVHKGLQSVVVLQHQSAKQPAAHDVFVNVAITMVLRKLLGSANKRGVYHGNAGDSSSWVTIWSRGGWKGVGLNGQRQESCYKGE
jgi:hypothetical protein